MVLANLRKTNYDDWKNSLNDLNIMVDASWILEETQTSQEVDRIRKQKMKAGIRVAVRNKVQETIRSDPPIGKRWPHIRKVFKEIGYCMSVAAMLRIAE